MNSMAGVNRVLKDRRFAQLRSRARLTDAEALGLLLIFWATSRELRMTTAPDRDSLRLWLPCSVCEEDQLLAAMIAADYVRICPTGEYTIVDNVSAQAEYERRAAIGSIGGKASAAKRAKKVRKKRTAKVAIEHSQAMTQGVSTAPTLNVQAWEAYSSAYEERWSQLPVSNAVTRAQMSAIVKRIGARAVEVMVFYVWHNDRYYILKQHPVGLALKDCESLATQCSNNQSVTSHDVQQKEREYGQLQQLRDIRASKI
ncbi:MAG: hypothetical protein EOO77_11235 [Oxalobacteraceae bacterium]|nr:MAG: hypothetical protein EOO77_11235 [Oxalobacteraceae bacterium]